MRCIDDGPGFPYTRGACFTLLPWIARREHIWWERWLKEAVISYKEMTAADHIIEEGTIYRMTPTDGSKHVYIGATSKTLEERLKAHGSKLGVKIGKVCDRNLYKKMAEKGTAGWHMEPLASLWLCTRRELLHLEKRYIRLLKPDLNSLDGSKSDRGCEADLRRSTRLWMCPFCLVTCRISNRWNHRQTRYHRAVDRLLFELD